MQPGGVLAYARRYALSHGELDFQRVAARGAHGGADVAGGEVITGGDKPAVSAGGSDGAARDAKGGLGECAEMVPGDDGGKGGGEAAALDHPKSCAVRQL